MVEQTVDTLPVRKPDDFVEAQHVNGQRLLINLMQVQLIEDHGGGKVRVYFAGRHTDIKADSNAVLGAVARD
ncbi:hypothetical protein [Candidatus Palauibacter sp.]|uniref:hypothetical protein n=1 Tax=Candidatus Palauibacter sp. TaxID=3101350 RepID=UPI003B59E1FC